jgi:hypothetical protein
LNPNLEAQFPENWADEQSALQYSDDDLQARFKKVWRNLCGGLSAQMIIRNVGKSGDGRDKQSLFF